MVVGPLGCASSKEGGTDMSEKTTKSKANTHDVTWRKIAASQLVGQNLTEDACLLAAIFPCFSACELIKGGPQAGKVDYPP